jgi:hypothetical protein
MEQMIVLWMLGLLALAGFVVYPRLMFGLLGSLVRGLFSLIVDAFALLLVWI